MNKSNLFFLALVFCFRAQATGNFQINGLQSRGETMPVSFVENKGQVHDQSNNARPDVLFSGSSGNLVFHLTANGISQQLTRVAKNKDERSLIYRVDFSWDGANKKPELIPGKKLEGYSNYYFDNCPQGILSVPSYESVVYKNIYPGIDLKWYGDKGELKYDYIVAPGMDYKQIKLKVTGATSIRLSRDGNLIVKTPLGEIVQQSPTAFQGSRSLECSFVLIGSQLSFEVKNFDPTLPLIIDPPSRIWGTYYGGYAMDEGSHCATDLAGNVYLSGTTQQISGTAIATAGSHQQSIGGGTNDAFLAKFNSAGVRQWGTYLGGSGDDYGMSCATDLFGNVYICGHSYTSGGNGIATIGSHQSAYGGNRDAFLVKFNASGVRQWGTYYGGATGEDGNSCTTDPAGNVYLTGYSSTTVTGVIATPGSFQPTCNYSIDAFLVKFNANGNRQWGTYYGGYGSDVGLGCAVDGAGNVCLVGATASSDTNIATQGSHQQIYGGGNEDGFLAKFTSAGARLWSSYFGGSSSESINSCAFDPSGNIIVAGQTISIDSLAIADPTSHQPGPGGNSDAFLGKFDASGVKQWSTYYGGSDDDYGYACATDALGNVYLSGTTESGTGVIIATTDGFQPVMSGFNDAFLVKFSPAGSREWGTYYGGNNIEIGNCCSVDASGNIYLGCTTGSDSNNVSSPGSHQPVFGGVRDAFLVKFGCTSSPTPSVQANSPVCVGSVLSFSGSASGSSQISFFWSGPGNFTSAIQNPSLTVSGTNNQGNYALLAYDTAGCYQIASIAVTVLANPTVSVTNSPTLICSGETATLNAYGASSYTWDAGVFTSSVLVSPAQTQTYSLTASHTNGCVTDAVITQSVSECAGITETQKTDFLIYPNPSNGSFVIEPGSSSDVIITGLLGQIVFRSKLTGGKNLAVLDNHASGTYLVHFIRGDEHFYRKLIVE